MAKHRTHSIEFKRQSPRTSLRATRTRLVGTDYRRRRLQKLKRAGALFSITGLGALARRSRRLVTVPREGKTLKLSRPSSPVFRVASCDAERPLLAIFSTDDSCLGRRGRRSAGRAPRMAGMPRTCAVNSGRTLSYFYFRV